MARDLSDHLEDLRNDIRGEIRQRIEQRDKYSVQLTISVAAISAFALSQQGTLRLLFAAPIASLYFTVLILYSYTIHDLLAAYLRDVIEPRLAQRHGIAGDVEFETHYARQRRPGIRREFFLWAHWVVVIASCMLVFVYTRDETTDRVGDFLLTLLIVGASLIVATPKFWARATSRNAPEQPTEE